MGPNQTKSYYTYILANQTNGTLYIGMTNNVERRICEHRNKINPGFTSKYNVTILVYYKEFGSVFDALACEKKLKHLPRKRKLDLISSINPHWQDLSEEWRRYSCEKPYGFGSSEKLP